MKANWYPYDKCKPDVEGEYLVQMDSGVMRTATWHEGKFYISYRQFRNVDIDAWTDLPERYVRSASYD